MKEIKNALSLAENFCKENNLSIIECDIEENEALVIRFNKEEAIHDFLGAFKNSKEPFLLFSKETIDISKYEEEESIFLPKIEVEEKSEYNSLKSKLNGLDGENFVVSFNFIHGGALFQLNLFHEKHDDIVAWEDFRLELSNTYIEKEDAKRARENRDKTLEYARMLANNESFQSAKNEKQRDLVAKTLINDPHFTSIYQRSKFKDICAQAKFIIDFEITPKREAEIKKNVKELKAKGLKKIEITAQLGISKNTVDKYF